MLRLVFVIAGALLVLNGAKALGYVDDACTEQCPDDDPTGHCPPGCGDCSCCAHFGSALPAIQLTVAVAAAHPALLLVDGDHMPTSVHPRELLHVPKPCV
jgi:hypothetical protein